MLFPWKGLSHSRDLHLIVFPKGIPEIFIPVLMQRLVYIVVRTKSVNTVVFVSLNRINCFVEISFELQYFIGFSDILADVQRWLHYSALKG